MDDGWKDIRTKSYLARIAIPGLLSNEECARVLEICATRPLEPGRTWDGTGYRVDTRSRNIETASIPRTDATEWIYDRMDRAFFRLADVWGLDVRSTLEDLKYIVYRPGSHFTEWHMDTGPDYSNLRKLSMSVELNSSAEYDGGELHIFPFDSVHVAGPTRSAGTAVVFPSHRYHRVTPVTRGNRHVLVNWISGPPLR